MMNSPIQPVQQGTMPIQTLMPVQKPENNFTTKVQDISKNKEQSLAIAVDISAEYSAISRINTIISDIAAQLKTEENPERQKLLEARLNTLNNMVLQREEKINNMEKLRQQFDNQEN